MHIVSREHFCECERVWNLRLRRAREQHSDTLTQGTVEPARVAVAASAQCERVWNLRLHLANDFPAVRGSARAMILHTLLVVFRRRRRPREQHSTVYMQVLLDSIVDDLN